MHSTYSRISNAGALLTSVVLVVLGLVASTTFVVPVRVDPRLGRVAIDQPVHVVKGVSRADPLRAERDYAFVKFDLHADLSPAFDHWNTKQVFVSLVAESSSSSHTSQVVLWDRIVTSKRHARIHLELARQKYEYKSPAGTFANQTATYSVHYHIQPYVGALTHGELARTEPIEFPRARTRSQ
ncbi:hypothetical protein JCM11491_004445 [Sporobolomyces phaffii]